jgi:hypothetical protein
MLTTLGIHRIATMRSESFRDRATKIVRAYAGTEAEKEF